MGGDVALSEAELLEGLTPAQREAVTTVDGPLLVIAAAGSGKTRVLTRRVAYLMAQGIAPGSILAITFTNKAAQEMKSRVGAVLGYPLRDWGRLEPGQPTICTFHSLCMRILRQYGPRVGLRGMTIFDTSDQTTVVKEALKALDMSSTNFPPGAVLGTISNAKNKLLSPAAFRQQAGDFYQKQVARVYEKYQAMLDAQGAMDFDDLLLRTVQAFKDHHDVLAELQERFEYLMIDEYQDTNHAQYVLSAALAMKRRNLCVVGDPDQSIYAWRGADIQNILDFKTDYPDAKEVKLEQNYRSTKTILAAADKLIKNNSRRVDKRLITDNPDGEKIKVVMCQDEQDEAGVVVSQLKTLNVQGVDWRKMAVFYRMNSLSRVVEDALRRGGVPYVMVRGTAFYDRREIKDVLAYLRVIANPRDEVSLERVVNTPSRGISDPAVEKLRAYGVGRGMGLWEAMGQAEMVDGITTRAKNSVKAFTELVKGWRQAAGTATEADAPRAQSAESLAPAGSKNSPGKAPARAATPDDMFAAWEDSEAPADAPVELPVEELAVEELADEPADEPADRIGRPAGALNITRLMEKVVKESGLEAMYVKESKGGADQGSDPIANVNELISSAAEFDREFPDGTLEEYLTQVALVSDVDGLKDQGEAGGGGAVTMMTLHAAKGLEFPVVAMVGLEEGVLPHSRAAGNLDELEEERRLCFVGITRAQERLIMTRAAYRTIRGLRERTATSIFLKELPEDRVELEDRTQGIEPGRGGTYGGGFGGGGGGRYATTQQINGRTVNGQTYREGLRVRHPTFGVGTIAEVSGSGQQTRCVIEFERAGRKTLILEYTKLEVVG